MRFGELDPYNHVNHAVYVAWFEAGRAQALSDMGMALHVMSANGWQMVVTDLQVRFRRPAIAGDLVIVETWIRELGGARSTWSQRIVRRKSETGIADGNEYEVLCEAEVRAGSTDSAGRPTRFPPELRHALTALSLS